MSIKLVNLCRTFRCWALIHKSIVFSKHPLSCLCSLRNTQTPLSFRSSSVSYLPTPLIFPVTGNSLTHTYTLFWNYRSIKFKKRRFLNYLETNNMPVGLGKSTYSLAINLNTCCIQRKSQFRGGGWALEWWDRVRDVGRKPHKLQVVTESGGSDVMLNSSCENVDGGLTAAVLWTFKEVRLNESSSLLSE